MTSRSDLDIVPGQCIDGVWQAGQGPLLDIINPSTAQPLARLAAADGAAVDLAVRAAQRALPNWRLAFPAQRAALLRKIARAIEAASDSLIALQIANNGKPEAEAAFDIADAVACWDYYADLIESAPGGDGQAVALPDPGFAARLVLEPCGVVGLITPWNFPMVTTAWKLAPALAAGCTVVLKPSELTPLAEMEIVRILHRAGLPAGVVNLVCGTGPQVGAAMADHPAIAKLSFTGSTAVGRSVMRAAAADIKRISLELGGKSSLIVCDDADLDLALELALKGAFFNAGQMCSATARILLQQTIYPRFLKRFRALTEALVLGRDIGPLISQTQRQRVEDMIRLGLAQGASLLTGGSRPPEPGFFYPPTILADLTDDNCLWRDEIFGPVACVRPFDSDEQAVALANDSPYGLVATVVTADAERARRLSDGLAVGLVWINAPQVIFPQTAWGGFKQSGLGRELGPWGLRAYQEIKHVVSVVPTL